MSVSCRKFQAEAVDETFRLEQELRAAGKSTPRVALIAPTGAGKTAAIGVEMVRRFLDGGRRVLWIAPGPNLVMNAASALLKGGLQDIGVIASGFSASNPTGRLQVGSVFTIQSRRRFPPADVVVWDECHRCTASTWSDTMGYYEGASHIGLTATLYGETGCVADIFDEVVAASTYRELVEQGHIAPCEVYCPPDGKPSELLRQYGGPSGSLVFCPSHGDAEEVLKELAAESIAAEFVKDTTAPMERRRIFARLECGKTEVVVGCDVFTDGIDFITPSRVLFRHKVTSRRKAFQAAGRVRRMKRGVTDGKVARVIDPHRSMCLHGPADSASDISFSGEVSVCETCFLLKDTNSTCKCV